ncbi:hypothetical protein BDF19DRAFT_448219 [Syncephalis fuscata]|nr:hypothetical protein BDF19DRAFT_448219 [Syncephalis fuscata]
MEYPQLYSQSDKTVYRYKSATLQYSPTLPPRSSSYMTSPISAMSIYQPKSNSIMARSTSEPMTYGPVDYSRPNELLCVDGRPHYWVRTYLFPCLLLTIFMFPFGLLSMVLLRHRECRKCGRTTQPC